MQSENDFIPEDGIGTDHGPPLSRDRVPAAARFQARQPAGEGQVTDIKEKNPWGIEVYHHPNPEIASFLVPEEISPPRLDHFTAASPGDPGISPSVLGRIGSRAVGEILAVPGVKEVRVRPKEIRVKKETGVPWEDIEARIIHILEGAVRKKRIKAV